MTLPVLHHRHQNDPDGSTVCGIRIGPRTLIAGEHAPGRLCRLCSAMRRVAAPPRITSPSGAADA